MESNLANVRFKYDPIINQDLYESVIEMYGLEFYQKTGPYITYNMFMQMLEVTRLASSDKSRAISGELYHMTFAGNPENTESIKKKSKTLYRNISICCRRFC